MGITLESQTVAALVKISKYNLKSTFDHCSWPDRIPAKGITNVHHNFYTIDLRNKCSLLGIVMGITAESQTVAA